LVGGLIGRRRWRRDWRRGRRVSATKLQVSYVLHIERVHAIADRHPDVTGVTAQVLAGYHSSIEKSECVGATEGRKRRGNGCQTKQHWFLIHQYRQRPSGGAISFGVKSEAVRWGGYLLLITTGCVSL
jgi:hypothetical protein